MQALGSLASNGATALRAAPGATSTARQPGTCRGAASLRCRAERAQRHGSLPPSPPPLPPAATATAFDRRGLLALLAAAPVALQDRPAAAAVVAKPTEPLPVPPLTETFISSEGFAFDYPGGGTWVKAFDRSGSSGNGAVVVVGDFRRLLTVSVFRSEGIDASAVQEGLTADSGYEVCVEPARADRGTMRFSLLRSEAVPPAYEYEYSLETCAGEIEEGLKGRLRCLSPFSGAIPTTPKRHIGRCVLVGSTAYSLTATSPESEWEIVGPLLRAVVSTFRAA